MKHLVLKRTLDVDRLEFFPQAETFAAMVKLEYVLTTGDSDFLICSHSSATELPQAP